MQGRIRGGAKLCENWLQAFFPLRVFERMAEAGKGVSQLQGRDQLIVYHNKLIITIES